MISVGITAVEGERTESLAAVISDLDTALVHISYDDRTRGPYGNFQDCLAWLVKYRPAERYLILQDDVRTAKGLMPWLEYAPDGVLSPYCAGPHHQEEQGWFRLDSPRRAYGACALVLPHEIAVRFLQNPPNRSCRTRTCFWLAEFCREQGVDYWIHSPSLVQHVGTKSLVDPVWDTAEACRPFREARVWCEDVSRLPLVGLANHLAKVP